MYLGIIRKVSAHEAPHYGTTVNALNRRIVRPDYRPQNHSYYLHTCEGQNIIVRVKE